MVLDLDPEQAVRLLTADVDPTRELVTAAQVNQYLLLNGGNYRRAAADVLDAIAVSELLVSKVIRTQDLQTDGAKVAAELRARADRLRKQADDEAAADTGDIFDVVPTGTRRPHHAEHTPGHPADVWGL